jgi:hypothetical protein
MRSIAAFETQLLKDSRASRAVDRFLHNISKERIARRRGYAPP